MPRPISYAVFCLKKRLNLTAHLDQMEKTYVLEALRRTEGSQTNAAELLKMSVRSLRLLLDKHGIRPHPHSFPTRRSSDLNDQIKEMTRKVSAEVDLVHQQTQNQRYGSSHIGATAKDISNVVTDAASGVVDIFHGIDKAVADTWNNFWKDGKADGIGSNLSRK